MNAVDTNVLVYAFDTRSPERQKIAIDLIENLSPGVFLWQVACEFLSASRKLQSTGVTIQHAWNHLNKLLLSYPLITPSEKVLARAKTLVDSMQLQFWDAMIYAACLEGGVTRLYSEDLPGGNVPGLQIVNPFAHL